MVVFYFFRFIGVGEYRDFWFFWVWLVGGGGLEKFGFLRFMGEVYSDVWEGILFLLIFFR